MGAMSEPRLDLVSRTVLGRPWMTILVVLAIVAAFGVQTPHFRLDASSDSLVLENDEALEYYRVVRERYGSDDYLIVTYTPEAPLFDADVLRDLGRLRDALRVLERVEGVRSILDVPLLENRPVGLSDLRDGAPTLEDPTVDPALARRELLSSPLYRDVLIAEGAQTTALLVQFARDEGLEALRSERDALRKRRAAAALTAEERTSLAVLNQELDSEVARSQRETQADIAAVRAILDRHRDSAVIHLGGVPMIVADSMKFIRQDMVSFGLGVLCFLVVLLGLAFRRPRWVALPLLICAAVGITVVGFLGWARWPVTVVSANFISLLLIITLSLSIHLIVSYQEFSTRLPDASQRKLVASMLRDKTRPCVYTAITTAVAFGSLVVSGIRPVIDFGLMMVVGIAVALVVSFSLFPAMLVLMDRTAPREPDALVDRGMAQLAKAVRARPAAVPSLFAALTVVAAAGFAFLSVENRFINYFKESTEIHRGMVLIDREFGGTMPLDVVIDAPEGFFEREREDDAGEEDDEFVLDWSGDGGITASSYWFKTARFDDVARVHDVLDARPEIGKMLSLWTAMRMLESVDEEATHDDLFLSILYRKLPENIRAILIDPYFSEDAHQLRFAARVFESDPSLERQRLLEEVEAQLVGELGLEAGQVHLTGMLVLYNNMLQSLFRSQILTVGVVFGAIWLVLAIVFRNVRLANVAIVPNVFAGGSVLGLMGWLGVPLDLMTITIAAISIGIGVDDTIHYAHRMQEEVAKDGSYWSAVERSHLSVGRALFYTTATIALGFSILALSNFVPTIYFGLLTGLAMVSALVADLVLLPAMLVRYRPF
jgi:predicted RND superfamily exporter protein